MHGQPQNNQLFSFSSQCNHHGTCQQHKTCFEGKIGWFETHTHASGGKFATAKYHQENEFPQTRIKIKKKPAPKPKLCLILYKLHFQFERSIEAVQT